MKMNYIMNSIQIQTPNVSDKFKKTQKQEQHQIGQTKSWRQCANIFQTSFKHGSDIIETTSKHHSNITQTS